MGESKLSVVSLNEGTNLITGPPTFMIPFSSSYFLKDLFSNTMNRQARMLTHQFWKDTDTQLVRSLPP